MCSSFVGQNWISNSALEILFTLAPESVNVQFRDAWREALANTGGRLGVISPPPEQFTTFLVRYLLGR